MSGAKPFIFSIAGLNDKSIWPHFPVPNATGIFIPGIDNRYKTIELFNYSTRMGGEPLYFANIYEDNSVKWSKFLFENLE